ncbi:MAG: hypothetical protein J2P21_22810 [Chloracidobacterium sp.]|nr:hypothetical protein [Chloracidobacterium sp.]
MIPHGPNWALFDRLKSIGLPIERGLRRIDEVQSNAKRFTKERWIDAGCVGKNTPEKIDIANVQTLLDQSDRAWVTSNALNEQNTTFPDNIERGANISWDFKPATS